MVRFARLFKNGRCYRHNQIMDTHRNDSNSDVEDLDFINFDENIEISLEEEIFDEKSDPEDITIVDIESR